MGNYYPSMGGYAKMTDLSPYAKTTDVNSLAAQQLAAMLATVPQPASAAPPAVVSGDSVKGASAQFALADHTHKSSVQRQRVAIALTGSTGKGVWTYPVPYPAGTVPVVQTTVETPDLTTSVLDAKVVANTVSNTGCTIMVNRFNQSITLPGLATSLLGLVLNLFSQQTGTVTVHCWVAPSTG